MKTGALVAVTCLGALAAAVSCDGGTRSVAIEDAAVEITDVFCGRMFGCDCDNGRRYEARAECEDDVHQEVEELRTQGEELGLLYDAECIGGWLDALEDRGCGPDLGSGNDVCIRPCNPYFGGKREGDQCDSFANGVTDCAQGLRCAGICVDPCEDFNTERAQLGEDCSERSCAEDLTCSEGRRCVELAGPGDSCATIPCRDGAFCEATDPMDFNTRECFETGDQDDECMGHDQCKSGYCPNGFCGSVPGEGDDCDAGVCSSGLQCTDGSCVRSPAAICLENMPF